LEKLIGDSVSRELHLRRAQTKTQLIEYLFIRTNN